MAEYIEREAALESAREKLLITDALPDGIPKNASVFTLASMQHSLESIPAADVRPVVVCADCKYNNACMTQAFVEDESKVPFDRNTFFCADGKRADDA